MQVNEMYKMTQKSLDIEIFKCCDSSNNICDKITKDVIHLYSLDAMQLIPQQKQKVLGILKHIFLII